MTENLGFTGARTSGAPASRALKPFPSLKTRTLCLKGAKCKSQNQQYARKENKYLITILIALVVSFLVVVLPMPSTIRLLKENQSIGLDVHKYDKPEVPKGAGFLILFAIVSGLFVVIGISTFQDQGVADPGLLAALVSILMAGMIGVLDDNYDFRNRTKILLPLVASIPMIAMRVGTTTMNIPFIGSIDLGIIYPLVIVPLMMTFIVDATNMYGGMNGLETGLAAINASAIILYVILMPIFLGEVTTETQIVSGTVAAALLGASIGFLIFNWYPAKVLPGDIGRLPIGAAIAAALILGNMDRIAVILYLPFLLNFLLYLIYRIYLKRSGREYVKFASPREDGTLEVVGPYTMYWILPHFSSNMTEKKNVILLILLQAIIAYGTIFSFLLVLH
jgi:UDP-N-acetylglucosamine--dolichyl-phosphate N-acetylglucosaminephosphotransferase